MTTEVTTVIMLKRSQTLSDEELNEALDYYNVDTIEELIRVRRREMRLDFYEDHPDADEVEVQVVIGNKNVGYE